MSIAPQKPTPPFPPGACQKCGMVDAHWYDCEVLVAAEAVVAAIYGKARVAGKEKK